MATRSRMTVACFNVLVLLLIAVGIFVAWGPYQDDRTQNLMRNSAVHEVVPVPSQAPTHFRLLELLPLLDAKNSVQNERRQMGVKSWRRRAPPILFVHGHFGKWLQGINLAVYLNFLTAEKQRCATFAVDFSSSASALHSNVLAQQAEFVAASLAEIAELYRGVGSQRQAITVVAHSMGGLATLEALRLLPPHSRVNVGAVIMISTPILGHPLLLGPGFRRIVNNIRGFLETSTSLPTLVALDSGETDPMVPREVVAWPFRGQGHRFSTPSLHNVYSSFSHINFLFSRHFLDSFAKLVASALQGRLEEEIEQVTASPFQNLAKQSRGWLAGTKTASIIQLDRDAGSSVERARKYWMPSNEDQPSLRLTDEALWEALKKFQSNRGAAPTVLLDQLPTDVPTVLPHHGNAKNSFSLLLMAKPRSITRSIEHGTKGEDFQADDILECDREVLVEILLARKDFTLERVNVSSMSIQYPAKACLFLFQAPALSREDDSVVGMGAVVRRLRNAPPASTGLGRLQKQAVSGWAQWQDDPFEENPHSSGEAYLTMGISGWWSWLASAFRPYTLQSPAKRRPLVSQLRLDLGSLPSLRPLDFEIAGPVDPTDQSAWSPGPLLIAVEEEHERVMVGAPKTHAPAWYKFGWAAESNADIFTPRFENTPSQSPVLLLIADPASELSLRVRGNIWFWLSRPFRTYIGHLLAAWLGALLTLQSLPAFMLLPLPLPPLQAWLGLLLWATASVLLFVLFNEALAPEDEALPCSPTLDLLLLIHFLGAFIAHLSRNWILLLAGLASKIAGGKGRWVAHAVAVRYSEGLVWLCLSVLHPSGCLLLMCLRAPALASASASTFTCASACASSSSSSSPSPTADTGSGSGSGSGSALGSPRSPSKRRALEKREELVSASWVGFASLLGLHLLSAIPSLALSILALVRQLHEAASRGDQADFLASLKTSRHAPTWLVDSWLLAEYRPDLLSNPLALLTNIAVGLWPFALAFGLRSLALGVARGEVSRSRWQSGPSDSCRLLILGASLQAALGLLGPFAVLALGPRPSWLWPTCALLCGPLFAALLGVLAVAEADGRRAADKVE